MVTGPGGNTARQHAALPDRDGSLRRGTSSQSQAQGSWSRCPADAGEVRSPVFEGTEERLPRRGGDRRGGATANDEVCGDEDRRSARPAGAASSGVRERLVSQRTGIINQIRAFLLERGIAVRQGQRFLRAELPRILAAPPDVLSPRMVHVIEGLAGDWRRLDERIEGLSGEIEAIARRDAGCERLMSVPGIGPIISSAMVAAIGDGDAFGKGRDFAAWLGLVPKQTSTGDRTILGKISKRGNRYLRVLFVQAAWVVLIKPKSWERHGLKPWIEAAKKRLHHNVLAIALANKLARIAWAVLNKERGVTAPRSPISRVVPSTSTMGSRRRAAAIASPSRVWAFSRTRNASSSAWKVLRPPQVLQIHSAICPQRDVERPAPFLPPSSVAKN